MTRFTRLLLFITALGLGLPAARAGDKRTDVNDIAQGILELLTDPARAEELSLRGKTQAERFSWDQSAEKLMQIYQRLGA